MTQSASYFAAVCGVSSGSMSASHSHWMRGSSSTFRHAGSKIGLPSALRLSRVMPTRNLSCAIDRSSLSTISSPREAMQSLQPAADGALQQEVVHSNAEQPEPQVPVLPAPVVVG